MSNRYFRATLTAGLGMIAVGTTAIVLGGETNIKGLIYSFCVFVICGSLAIWGIVNLIKGRCDNG